ncbi:hypothetical protein FACS1894127_5960 [Clostridia bacterium]|nr:hypothetical protein FACS1894127_5960 [Clostridia bacterium]
MATTWIKSLHVNKGKTIAQTLADRTDYARNPDKTNCGELVTSFGCDSRVADYQFLLAKRRYEHITGRTQGKRNVLAYHIRQSFKPGEISAEEANEIGRQLALSFTKSSHAFIVATHIDTSHIHNHIIFNSTTLNCERKFADFPFSAKAIRRISDLLCAEHGLSIIENPKPPHEHYGEWLGENKKPTHKDDLRRLIDEAVSLSSTFDDFLVMLRERGCTVSRKRKQPSLIAPGWKKPFRLDSLGGEYTETAIRARLGKVKVISSSGDSGTHNSPSLLIDIQAKIREGKGAGYEQWAKVFNLKQAAKTLVFLQEQGIDSYDDLKRKTTAAADEFDALSAKIKDTDKKLKGIAELQKQISIYGKTRAVFDAYKRSGYDRAYYDTNAADIILHRAAKKYFDAQGFKSKLPSRSSLKQDYAATLAEKKKYYADYHRFRDLSKEMAVAKANADKLLNIAETAPKHDVSHTNPKRNKHER